MKPLTSLRQASDRRRGYAFASGSAIAFGLIPLFSIPVLKAGISIPSTLVYRFAFGSLFMIIFLFVRRVRLSLTLGEALELSLLALLYSASAVCLYAGYRYMPSGVATTLLFSYPIFTALIEVIFYHKRMTAFTIAALLLSVLGVFLLSGCGKGGIHGLVGLFLELGAGLAYAIYMAIFPHLRVHRMNPVKVNFFVFFISMLFLLLVSVSVNHRLDPVRTVDAIVCLMLLGLLPTMLSNVLLVKSLNLIDATTVSVLGAFEPLTAMSVGILVMGEPLTVTVVGGLATVIAAVYILVTH